MTIRPIITSSIVIFFHAKTGIAWVCNSCAALKYPQQYGRQLNYDSSTLLASATTEHPAIDQWAARAIDWVDDIHRQSSTKSPFAIEIEDESSDDDTSSNACVHPFEWMEGYTSLETCEETRNVALRTLGKPLLDIKAVTSIRKAAQSKWDGEQSQTSRFTLQFSETNSECHLDELVTADTTGALKETVDTFLTTNVYPFVRSAFGSHLGEGRLCVYDSLVIRYDGDKAKGSFGASQPLHRDGGIISVNIALNSHEGDAITGESGFEGGGTFFEDLIRNPVDEKPIVRPSAPGHAVAHLSTVRHAGTPTTSGIREIVVFFLTLRETGASIGAPPVERAFHLKMNSKTKDMARPAALKCLDLAIGERPEDGEAHFLKGVEMMRNPSKQESVEYRWQEINESVFHLQRAKELAPFDARIKCFAGMAKKTRFAFAQRTGQEEFANNGNKDLESAMTNLEDSIFLHDIYLKFGISSDFDVATAILSLGEVFAQLERYQDAIQCLVQLESKARFADDDVTELTVMRTKALIGHCEKELECSIRVVPP